MSGHSKWANIKRRKQAVDSKRGNVFTKLAIAIATAVKQGGSNIETNWKLKNAIDKAKASNMPNDNISKIIKRASGNMDADYEEITYEGYGPSGVAIIVEAATNNKNRTAADLRHIFDKSGGNLGTSGCVSYMFDKKGVLLISKYGDENGKSISIENLEYDCIESGADDFNDGEEYFEILTSPELFTVIQAYMQKKGYKIISAEIQMIPNITIEVNDEKHIESINKILDKLEDLDDIQNVYHNGEFSDI